MHRFPILFSILMIPFLCFSSRADVLELKSGAKLTGKVILERGDSLVVDLGYKVVEVPREEILRRAADEEEAQSPGMKTPAPRGENFYTVRSDLKETTVRDNVERIGEAVVMVSSAAGLGSGFLIHPDGYVVTNHHVIAGERKLSITRFVKEGREFRREKWDNVRIVAFNPHVDLALLKIETEPEKKFPFVTFASSPVRNGQTVFAVGNPLGLERSVTEGIVSSRNRNFDGLLFIQVSAPINPGNSGGPLFNLKGEVVGVVNMKLVSTGVEGVGFAIPVEYLVHFLENRDAFAFNKSNPNTGHRYLEPPAKEGEKGTVLEMIKLDRGMFGLQSADLNGDGLNDLFLINNPQAKIEILYQKKEGEEEKKKWKTPGNGKVWEPVLEDLRFRRESLLTGMELYELEGTDLDADGRIDLVYVGSPDGLVIRFAGENGTWDRKEAFRVDHLQKKRGTLGVKDLDADGRPDLALLTGREVVIRFQQEEGGYARTVRYPTVERDCGLLSLEDLNGDGRVDLVYFSFSSPQPLRARLQEEDRRFGPEMAFDIDTPRAVAFDPASGGEPAQIWMLDRVTGRLERRRWTPAEGEKDRFHLSRPRRFSIGSVPTERYGFAVGDLDGDGRIDLLASSPKSAELVPFYRTAGGDLSESEAYPSLSDVVSLALADLDGDGLPEAAAASPKEKLLGLARRLENGRLSFPSPLPADGKPVAVCAGDFDGDGTTDLAYTAEDGGERFVEILHHRGEGFEKGARIELAELRTDPSGLLAADANRDGRMDLVVFVPYESIRYLSRNPEGEWEDLSRSETFRRGLVDRLAESACTVVDLDGDGKSELLVARGNFARTLVVDERGGLQVADQFNGKDSTSNIEGGAAIDFDGDGVKEVLLLDKKFEELSVLRRGKDGVYRIVDAVPVGRLDFQGMRTADLDADGREDLILLGRGEFMVLYGGRNDPELEVVETFETERERSYWFDLLRGDLTGDGEKELLLIDSGNHALELLSRSADGELESVLHFPVFEVDPILGERYPGAEPREARIADLNGDGKNDVALLAHDRVLIYLQ